MPQVSTPGLPSFMVPRTTPESVATAERIEANKTSPHRFGAKARGVLLARRYAQQTAGPGTKDRRDLLLSSAPMTSASSLASMYAAAASARDRVLSGGGF